MVDHAARKEFAELLRHFIAGRITNLEFDQRGEDLTETEDAALRFIYRQVWYLYDDFSEHRMVGDHKIDKAGRHEIARWILFLQNDLEYQWLYASPCHAWRHLISVLTFNLFSAFREPSYKDFGHVEVWPFYQIEDFESALRFPKLLAGT